MGSSHDFIRLIKFRGHSLFIDRGARAEGGETIFDSFRGGGEKNSMGLRGVIFSSFDSYKLISS